MILLIASRKTLLAKKNSPADAIKKAVKLVGLNRRRAMKKVRSNLQPGPAMAGDRRFKKHGRGVEEKLVAPVEGAEVVDDLLFL